MPPNFGEIIYGATAWSFKNPIAKKDIGPTFKQAREIFDSAGFSGKRCSIEVFASYEPTADLEYANVVRMESQKNNLVPITTIFRPVPNPSMVSEDSKEREWAIEQCGRGIEFAIAATPEGLPIVVNGPFQLVHGLCEEEKLGPKRRGYLINCLKEIGDTLETMSAYAALEILRPSETRMNPKTEHWLGILDKVGSPNLGLLVDTVHFYEGNDSDAQEMIAAIDKTCRAGRCYSVHLSNHPNRAEWGEKGNIAKHTGLILSVLQRNNYRGTVNYEGFDKSLDKVVGIKRDLDQQDQIEVARRSMAYLAGHVKQLAS